MDLVRCQGIDELAFIFSIKYTMAANDFGPAAKIGVQLHARFQLFGWIDNKRMIKYIPPFMP